MLRAVGRVPESGGEEKGRVKGRNERKATKTERKNLGVYARRERQGAERKGGAPLGDGPGQSESRTRADNESFVVQVDIDG